MIRFRKGYTAIGAWGGANVLGEVHGESIFCAGIFSILVHIVTGYYI